MDGAVPELATLDAVCALVESEPAGTLFVRYSEGPAADRSEHSRDYESGLALPGLSANPLSPERWWTRPLRDWIARRLCNYAHLADADPARIAWVLTGCVVARGPDDEPLVADHRPVATLAAAVVAEARDWYEQHFDAGRDSTG